MTLAVWLGFLLAAILIAVTPGPGAVISMSTGMRHGYLAALTAILGLQAAILLHLMIVALGLAEFLLKGGDALLVSAFHVIDLGADGSQFAVIGGVRAKGGSQHGCHGKTFLHGMLLKIAVRPLTTRLP